MRCISIQKRHRWQPSSVKQCICASYRLFSYRLCKDGREKLGEKQQKVPHWVTLRHNDVLKPSLIRSWEAAGEGALSPALQSHWQLTARCWCPLPSPNGAHSLALPFPPHATLHAFFWVTAASLACFWLATRYGLQIRVEYCLEMQPSVPRTLCTMWAIGVLPEGHPMWPPSLLSVLQLGKGRRS